ncbi:MAG: DUF1097 family protein [Syntrophaceticus sp.]|nr:DUF1097 family protein [Syntrophaceticus sp.]MDD3315632.1 DUF1097 family protein [Syntrophaceticus sp.]MDD4359811.1 DUF1097 family protein [Syntrophaceticus sp.]MDD4782832.1 DUF1097 family protein [Syntrophaceticus sp.]
MKKETVIAGLIVGVWLVLTLIILSQFGISQGWPAFLTLLFFFESGTKTENLKNIFVGAAVGLLLAAVMPSSASVLAPVLGMEPALLLVVFVIVFLIIALGDVAHLFFNNYAFAYFTVALIFPQQATLEWLAVLILGGIFFTGGILTIIKLMTRNKEATS